MDNLTHTLAGAALGEAGLKRLSGLGMAALMIGANLPDLDVIAIPFGANLTFRRGWTHGPLAMVLLPLALTAALVAFDRWQARRGRRPPARAPVRPGGLLLLAYVGVLSHPFLDWLNSYGIRLLMPFSERWFYGDSIFIVDPWLWATLGAGVWIARRWGRRWAARGAVALAALYVTGMIAGTRVAHGAAVRAVAEAEAAAPLRLMAGPVPIDPFRRTVIAEMETHYRLGEVFLPGGAVRLAGEIPIHADHPAAVAARESPEVGGFLYWSRFPYYVVDEIEGWWLVRVEDARFRGRGAEWSSVTLRVEREGDRRAREEGSGAGNPGVPPTVPGADRATDARPIPTSPEIR